MTNLQLKQQNGIGIAGLMIWRTDNKTQVHVSAANYSRWNWRNHYSHLNCYCYSILTYYLYSRLNWYYRYIHQLFLLLKPFKLQQSFKPLKLLQLFQVSWLRGRDTSVISVGHMTFSSSERFRVVSTSNPTLGYVDWNLEVDVNIILLKIGHKGFWE